VKYHHLSCGGDIWLDKSLFLWYNVSMAKKKKTKKKTKLGQRLIKSMQELVDVAKKGKKIEDHFVTTTYHENGSVTRTKPKKKA